MATAFSTSQADNPYPPPDGSVPVRCWRCQKEYESYQIEWREEVFCGRRRGWWACPTPGCRGRGFDRDILRTDLDYYVAHCKSGRDLPDALRGLMELIVFVTHGGDSLVSKEADRLLLDAFHDYIADDA